MRALCSALLAVWLPALPAAAIEITQVAHQPAELAIVGEGEVAIRFRLSEPAKVSAHLYDGRDLRIRTLESSGALPAGEHALAWDGRDLRGRPVPPEAYLYTLEASTPAGEQATWDLGDATGGELLTPERVVWDAAKKRILYTLPEPARIRLRVGLQDGGPLLRTLLDWVPRTDGPHAEPWDGKDVSGALDLSRHPRLELFAEAFALPHNAILVGPAAREVALLDGLDDAPHRSATRRSRAPRMFDYARQPIETRRDFPVTLELASEHARDAGGVPRVSGVVALRVGVAAADLARLLDERCEVVFFVDGQFVFETESGVLPTTWRWDTAEATPGTHYLTTNVRGYDGHFGVNTIQVIVAPHEDASRTESPRES